MVLVFLSLVTLDIFLRYLQVKVNVKNVHLTVHHVHLQFPAINVLMDFLFKILISLNLLLFRYALKFVEMEKDSKQIVMTAIKYLEMVVAKIVKLSQVGHV